jgi:hypothetical protein
MSRFFTSKAQSLDSFLGLITDLVREGFRFLGLMFRSYTALSAEILFLRKQLAFYEERQVEPRLNDSARFSLALWSRLFDWKDALVIVKPETLIGWHRKGFKLFGRRKCQAGRPRLPENVQKLIVRMARENPTWGQSRVAAELSIKIGIYISPRTVRAYWPAEPGRRGPCRTSSQHWKTFVRNHAQSVVACDFMVVVTARFRTLYVFLLMEIGTRRIVHCNVTHTRRQSGPCTSFAKRFQVIIPTVFSFATVTRSSRQKWMGSFRHSGCGCCARPREHLRQMRTAKG